MTCIDLWPYILLAAGALCGAVWVVNGRLVFGIAGALAVVVGMIALEKMVALP